jgi:hypothetical protein
MILIHAHRHLYRLGLLVACPMVLVLLLLSMTGCAVSATGDVGRLQSLASTCPDRPVLVDVRRDASGSQRDPELGAQALAVIGTQVEQAVACAAHVGVGRVLVVVFASNAAQTATVVSRDLSVPGATEMARLRRAVKDNLVVSVLAEVDTAYRPAVDGLVVKGSDVLSQFAVAGEGLAAVEQQTGREWALDLTVITDGFASRPVELKDKALTMEAAVALAEQTPRVELEAWRVRLVGVGRVAGDKPQATERIEAVKAFWTAWLGGMGETVAVMTDFPSGSAGDDSSDAGDGGRNNSTVVSPGVSTKSSEEGSS